MNVDAKRAVVPRIEGWPEGTWDASGIAMSKRVFHLVHQQARQRAIDEVGMAPDGYTVTVAEPTRNSEQNAAMWVVLQAFSEQLEWPVNGRMTQLDSEGWKDILSAAFKKENARLAMGLDGGVVMLGLRTSKMGKREFSEFLDFLHATAADRGVELDQRVAALSAA